VHLAVVLVATFIATVLSFTVSITEISISPIQLVPGVGMALLWRWGLSLWPAIVGGNGTDHAGAASAMGVQARHGASLTVGAPKGE
jgi:integral membrane sensor domain MASE1